MLDDKPVKNKKKRPGEKEREKGSRQDNLLSILSPMGFVRDFNRVGSVYIVPHSSRLSALTLIFDMTLFSMY